MYVCVCNGVTDRDIQRAALLGCTDMAELGARTGCGTTCGCCKTAAHDVLADAVAVSRQPQSEAA
ncbi:MAG: (2Fe-2S)-binding protein [Xanthomonadaceae bacterium]|nr:(2Fe-2S)-binding protein [Xanthomonadaceae bacterium]MDP2185252.1 (2Fe-2S)-binding protein [Xanthomonadales bacterium]MDZ4117062.1 (2Fe-2S)-binding protein [Xanthomonadaceae bacterium]MDZ4379287.1 (2Fe-2S)-binding protein [Xanthomonadaceae bacterium]